MIQSRPRRSALYMPASNAKAIEKARGLACDVVILDLEDAVAPENKAAARAAAVAAIRDGGFGGRALVLRVNALDTPWGADDLAAAIAARPDAVLVPKIDDGAAVRRYDAALGEADVALWTMIETARAMTRLGDIADAAADTRMTAWVIGTNDLAKEMRATLDATRAPFLGLLALAVAAARGAGLAILDGVYNDIGDAAGFVGQCAQGAAFGFDGKTLIHPSQIAPCNAAFTPGAEAVTRALAIVAAFADPANAGRNAILVDGRMIERLHLEEAEQLLALVAAVG
jgi:citrate lyase subunit beta/citryl-CoA lyase